MRYVFHLCAMIAVALAVGFGLSFVALNDGRLVGSYRFGPWAAWPAAGSPSPDPYTRAHIARDGALQLGQSEGLTFTAATDSDGRPLDRNCRYRIDGTTPVTSFWTLVPETADGTPIARPGTPAGFNSARIARANDGSAQLYVSRNLAPYNWVEITGSGPFNLVLTLYDLQTFAGFGAGVETLPSIILEGCA